MAGPERRSVPLEAGSNEELKEDFAGYFRNSPEDAIEVRWIEGDEGKPVALAEYQIRPKKGERNADLLSPDTTTKVQVAAEPIPKQELGKKTSNWRVINLELDIDGKKINVMDDLLPHGHQIYLRRLDGHSYSASEKVVFVEKLDSYADIASVLHEVGHAQDFAKYPQQKKGRRNYFIVKEYPHRAREYMSKKQIERAVMQQQEWERKAWANALNIVRSRNLPFDRYVRAHAQYALGTYDIGAFVRGFAKSQPRFFASSPQRKVVRGAEGKKQVEQFIELFDNIQEIRQLVEDAIEMDVGDAARYLYGVEKGRDKGFTFFFNLSDNTSYACRVHRHYLVVEEEAPKPDGSRVRHRIVVSRGLYVSAVVENFYTGKVVHEDVFRPNDAYSKSAEHTLEKAEEVLGKLQSREAKRRMAAAAFKAYYGRSDDPVSEDILQSDDLALLKKHLPMYQMMERLRSYGPREEESKKRFESMLIGLSEKRIRDCEMFGI